MHVVDGAHADPEEQVRAVREVLADVGAETVPELLVVNKTDAADEETLLRLKRLWPDAVFVSARTGAGLDELRAGDRGPAARPAVELDVAGAVRPGRSGGPRARTGRGARLVEHTGDGVPSCGVRVGSAPFAAELAPYARYRAR